MMALEWGIRALVDFQVTPPFGSNMSVAAAAGGKQLAMSHINRGFSTEKDFHPDPNNFEGTALPSGAVVGATVVG